MHLKSFYIIISYHQQSLDHVSLGKKNSFRGVRCQEVSLEGIHSIRPTNVSLVLVGAQNSNIVQPNALLQIETSVKINEQKEAKNQKILQFLIHQF